MRRCASERQTLSPVTKGRAKGQLKHASQQNQWQGDTLTHPSTANVITKKKPVTIPNIYNKYQKGWPNIKISSQNFHRHSTVLHMGHLDHSHAKRALLQYVGSLNSTNVKEIFFVWIQIHFLHDIHGPSRNEANIPDRCHLMIDEDTINSVFYWRQTKPTKLAIFGS